VKYKKKLKINAAAFLERGSLNLYRFCDRVWMYGISYSFKW